MVELLIYSIIGLFAGILLFYSGFASLKRKQMIEDVPTSKIRSLAMGLVEIYGSAVPAKGKLLQTPYSKTDCVYYKYEIQKLVRTKKSSYWKTIHTEVKDNIFFLEDETGAVLVDSTGAQVDIPVDNTIRPSQKVEFPKEFQNLLKTVGIGGMDSISFQEDKRYLEYLIAPKDKLYIMGTAGDNPYVEEATGVSNVHDIMIQKGRNDTMHYISDKSEKQLLSDLNWKVYGGLFGGGALILICLGIILLNMGWL